MRRPESASAADMYLNSFVDQSPVAKTVVASLFAVTTRTSVVSWRPTRTTRTTSPYDHAERPWLPMIMRVESFTCDESFRPCRWSRRQFAGRRECQAARPGRSDQFRHQGGGTSRSRPWHSRWQAGATPEMQYAWILPNEVNARSVARREEPADAASSGSQAGSGGARTGAVCQRQFVSTSATGFPHRAVLARRPTPQSLQ